MYVQADPSTGMTSVASIRVTDDAGTIPTTASTAGPGVNDGAYVFGPISLTANSPKRLSIYADIATSAPQGDFKLYVTGFGTVPGTTSVNGAGKVFSLVGYPFAKSNTVTIISSIPKPIPVGSSKPLTPSGDTTPRIMLWPGKVNQHTDAAGAWQTDPDGVSGGNNYQLYPNDYGGRELSYCKKWYPSTVSAQQYQTETISTWRAAGNTGSYTGTFMSYKCVQSATPLASVRVLSPNGGEVYQSGQQITIRWKTANYNENITEINLVPLDMQYGTGITFEKQVPNTGSYTTTLPPASDAVHYSLGKNFKIEVVIGATATNNIVRDLSDDTFTIQAPTTQSCTINSFTANPTTVTIGGSSTLAWSVTNDCNSVVINHGQATTNQLSTEGTISTSAIGGTSTPNTYILLASSTPGCFGAPYSTTTGQACSYINASTVISVQATNTDCPSTTPPSVAVLLPNGGEMYEAGQSFQVKWKSCNVPYLHNLKLSLVDTLTGTKFPLSNGVYLPTPNSSDNNGIHAADQMQIPITSWLNINHVNLGATFKIEIASDTGQSDGISVYDTSDNVFTVGEPSLTTCNSNTTPYVKVLSPNGGEIYQAGAQMFVGWSACNQSNGSFKIALENIATTFNTYIDGTTPLNQKSNVIVIPQTLIAGQYRARVFCGSNDTEAYCTGSSTTSEDRSDNSFTIVSSGSTGPGSGRPVAITSPVKTSFTRELKLGSTGTDVTALQNRLKAEGVYTSKISGYFGTMTQAAVKRYQSKYGIPAVGAVGPRTLQVLNK
jgi:hypothetical protein